MSTSLYRFYDANDVLLYVGITNSLPHRLAQHEAGKHWWTAVASASIEHYPTRKEAEDAERAAIRAELPVWNIAHQRQVPLVERLAMMRPLLVQVLEEIHEERQRSYADPTWCFYDAWYYGGLRQRAKFALYNEPFPEQNKQAASYVPDYDDVMLESAQRLPDGFYRLDDLLDGAPVRETYAHDAWVEEQWGELAERLMRMLPSCGRECEHYETWEEPF